MASDYWNEKACLVTGASAGLGMAISSALAKRGARLAVVARKQEPLDRAADQFRRLGAADVLSLTGDMVWQEDVDRVRQTVADEWGQLDLLCNSVGRSARKAVLETEADDFEQLLNANFMSAVRCTRAVSEMLLSSRGHVVNIGSLASKLGPPYMGAYPAAKHALAAYTQQLRMEHGHQGLHAILVCPGPIAGGPLDRYAGETRGLPAGARAAGGGAKLGALDPLQLAEKVLRYCERRKPELVAPGRVRLILAAAQLSPRLGDWFLRKYTAG